MRSIIVDQEKFVGQSRQFMRSPYSQKLWEPFEFSPVLGLVLSGLVFVGGLIQVLTIRWAKQGFIHLWKAISLDAMRECRSRSNTPVELFQPLICHGVIIGPTGHGLVLGSLDADTNHTDLAIAAKNLANLYSQPTASPADEETWKLLHEDQFRTFRRRVVPSSSPYAPGATLFDVSIRVTDGKLLPDTSVLYAFIVLKDEPGIAQLPWSIAENCLTVS